MASRKRLVAVVITLGALWAPVADADPPLSEDLEEASAEIAVSPSSVPLLIFRADLYLRADMPLHAMADLRLAGAIAPDDRRIERLRAEVLHAMHREDEALAEIDACIAGAEGPTGGELALRARILAALGRVEDAIEEYAASLAIRPQVAVYLEHGLLLERVGRDEDAVRGYDEGVSALGGPIVLRLAAIEVDLRIGRADRALRRIDEVLPHVPSTARWSLLRARALDALGRPHQAQAARAAALEEAERRLSRRPSAAQRVVRGEALLGLGRPGEALEEAGRALNLSPRLADALELRARAERAVGGAR